MDIIEKLKNVLIKSGVDILNAPKDLIFDFLHMNGVPKNKLDTVYGLIIKGLSVEKPKASDYKSKLVELEPVKKDASVNIGRKSVFGEIKKIT